jgi:hypothetical protein
MLKENTKAKFATICYHLAESVKLLPYLRSLEAPQAKPLVQTRIAPQEGPVFPMNISLKDGGAGSCLQRSISFRECRS